jgi:hypothetical protein
MGVKGETVCRGRKMFRQSGQFYAEWAVSPRIVLAVEMMQIGETT